MLKDLVAATVAAAFALAVGSAAVMPADATAAGRDKRPSICDKLTDKKKKAACVKAEATAKYNSQSPCEKITDKKKKASCQKAEANQKKKVEKKATKK